MSDSNEHSDASAGIRHRLRRETADLHARLDRRLGALFAMPGGYARFLSAIAAALVPLETAMTEAGVARLCPDWPMRRRTAAILEDLALVSVPVPALMPPPRIDSDAALMGHLYVLEGSRLGARVLAKEIAAGADLRVRAATHYLRHGSDQAFWPGFLALLDGSDAVRADPDQTVAGACVAFALFDTAARRVSPDTAMEHA